MIERTEWVALIRFYLDQLSVRNGHHEFERLAMEFARARIASNLLPGTGPVSAGGDQARDFETFRTYYVRNPEEPGFRRLASSETISFACTLQRDDVPGKIREDVDTTMNPPEGRAGPRPAVIYVFTGADVAVAKRHELQDWARRERGVSLEIIDGQALADQLADPDLHWIAATYLHLPRELAPPAPSAQDADDYTRALQFWRTHEVNPARISDFYEIKRWSRVAALKKRRLEDVPFWIEKLGAFGSRADTDADGGVPGRDPIARSAVFERALAAAAGLGNLAGVEEDIRAFFSDVASVRDPAELDDAASLLVHLTNVLRAGEASDRSHGFGSSDVASWRSTTEAALRAALEQQVGPSARCMLLETRALIGLISPAANAKAFVARTLDQFFEVVDAIPRAPLYPLSRFADRLTNLTQLLGDSRRFRELTERVDDLLAQRSGPAVGAAKARDRGMVFLRRKEWVPAMHQFQLTAGKWFTKESLWGSVASLLLIAECCRNLRLYSAAKHYGLAAAVTAAHTDQPRILSLLPHALFAAAQADYLQGAWLNFLALHGTTRRSFGVSRTTREAEEESRPDDEQMDDSLTYALAVSWRMARRLAPEMEPLFSAAAERWGEVPYVELYTERGTPWDRMSVDEIVASFVKQTGVAPLTDARPERTVRWSALGIDWRVSFPNTYEYNARGEEIASALQVIQAKLAERELALLPLAVEIRLEFASVDEPEIRDLAPDGELRRFSIRLPTSPVEEEFTAGEGAAREMLHIVGVIFYVLQDVSLLPRELLTAEMEYLMQHNIVGKLVVARPYAELFTTFISREDFAESERRSSRWTSTSMAWAPEPAEALQWESGPGPTYDEGEALTWIRNRYERAILPVRYTIARLARSSEFQQTLAVLRAEGWKDWHVLLAVMNIALNYRAQGQGVNLVAPGSDAAARLHAPEDEHTPAVPTEAFTPEDMRMMNDILLINSVGQVGLEFHQQQPAITAISRFLAARYRFWEDDVPHRDLFANQS